MLSLVSLLIFLLGNTVDLQLGVSPNMPGKYAGGVSTRLLLPGSVYISLSTHDFEFATEPFAVECYRDWVRVSEARFYT